MAWEGYPEGVVRIYFDGELSGEKFYDSRYDNGRPIDTTYRISGHRRHNGDIVNTSSGIHVTDFKIHDRTLTHREFMEIAAGY